MVLGWLTIQVSIVLFFATAIRSAFGFGEALVAVPLLALFMPVEVAAPVAVLVSITIAAIAVAQDWRHIHLKSAGWLVLSTLAGIPIGLLLLKTVPEPAVKALLALVILGFAGRSLFLGTRHHLANDRWAWMFGFSAGVLGGAYGMNGPPLAIYGSLRGWTPERFRATLQGYFLPASIVGMFGYWLAGLWTAPVSRLYVVSLPAVVAATIFGRVINRRLNAHQFVRTVHVCLLVIGAVLLVQAIVFHGAHSL